MRVVNIPGRSNNNRYCVAAGGALKVKCARCCQKIKPAEFAWGRAKTEKN